MAAKSRSLNAVFTAGCWGGLLNGLVVWAFGWAGISAALGVKIAPALTPGMLYPRVVWGGLWGLLFLLPGLGNSLWGRGLLLSLGPTLVQLLVVFPFKAHKGWLGLDLGLLTPLLVIFFNAVWGWGAAWWLRHTR